MNTLTKGEFLSFLYAEKSREIENNNAPGWSKWALWGIIASLSLFIYNLLVGNNVNASVVLNYFIYALPYVLGFIHFFFHMRVRMHTSLRVRKLIHESPVMLYIVRSLLSVVGFVFSIVCYINIMECILWGVVCAINIAIIVYILMNKNKLVPAKLRTYVFSNDNYDMILSLVIGFVYFAIYFIHSSYVDIQFLQIEFEVTVSFIAILLLFCKLINMSQQYSVAEGIDRIIECFTGGFISQEEAYKRYMNLLYGEDTLFVLKSEVDSLSKFDKKLEIANSDIEKMHRDIMETKPKIELCDIIIEKLDVYTELSEKCIKECQRLNKYMLDILEFPYTNMRMEDFEYANSSILKTNDLVEKLHKKIDCINASLRQYLDDNVYCKKYGTICYKENCVNRHDKMLIKHRVQRFLRRTLTSFRK